MKYFILFVSYELEPYFIRDRWPHLAKLISISRVGKTKRVI